MATYSCKNFSFTPYPLATIHPLQTDRQTDERTGGRELIPIARPLLKYGRPNLNQTHHPMIHFDSFLTCISSVSVTDGGRRVESLRQESISLGSRVSPESSVACQKLV